MLELLVSPLQSCQGQGKKIWKMKFFQVREKSGIFVGGQGNLEDLESQGIWK